MQTKSRTGHAAALSGAFAILLLVIGLEFWTEAKLTDLRTLILRTHEVGRCIQQLHTEVVEAVAARRAHALNPQPARADDVHRALEIVRRDQTRLRVLAAEDETQQTRLDRLDPLLAGLLDEIREAVRNRSGERFEPANEQRLLQQEDAAKNSAGALLDTLRRVELELLVDRQAVSRHTSYQARAIEALGVVISVWLLLVVYRTLRREIALRERSEHALRESEARLGITLDSIGDGVIVTDTQARVTRMNPVAERLTGMSLAEARGRAFSEVFSLIDERTHGPAQDPVARVLREGIGVELANHTALRAK
ncbi:MAG TPA: CHASE3 domain-containing protein, partial [Polyangiales bacterium]|nr:CHASE3 domain-containing protein [Polyangiales bacterium]